MVDPLKILWVLTNSTYLVSKFLKEADSAEDSPYFEKSLYQVYLRESELVGHHVITARAENHEEVPAVRYEIVSGNVGGVFAIDQGTGVVTLSAPLDYETKKQYSLQLAVADGRSLSYANLVVHVVDVNDNPPVFSRSSYRTQITEEDDRNLPKKILQVNVTDADKDRPLEVIYFLTGPGVDTDEPSGAQFSINSTSGDIYVLKPLDRDLPNGRAQWRFTVFAQDENGQGLVGYADVQVNLKDINDNAPSFPETVMFASVVENGYAGVIVLTMEAEDHDDPHEGGNARLTYNIEKNVLDEQTGAPIFNIDPRTGVIKTALCCLDREKTPGYTLQVIAMDGGGLQGTGTVSIIVEDINDTPPVFSKEEWVTELQEDQDTFSTVLTVGVIDQDENNDFYFKVVDGSGVGADKFSMSRNPDGTGALRLVCPLDYEDPLQRDGFRFKIKVNDQGPDGTDKYHEAYSWVVVRLQDVNDNPPVLDKVEGRVFLREDLKVGTLVDVITARDPDQGGSGRVTFSLSRNTDPKRHFRITQEGRIILQRPLDRETTPIHKLLVTVNDDGVPSLTSTASLVVTVLDVNDNPPTLLKDYRPVLKENSAPRVVVELFAQDSDDPGAGHGPPFTFLLDLQACPSLTGLFTVDTNPRGDNGRGTAIVSSLTTLDREHQKEYLLPIIIKDSGNPAMTGTSTLTVTVGDINDNHMVSGTTNITVYKLEGEEAELLIGQIYARDPDDWDLSDKTFSWASSSSPLPQFQLDRETGWLTMAEHTHNGRYHMRFTASDTRHGDSARCDVTVTVRTVSRQALASSQSLTLGGITDRDFIYGVNHSASRLNVLRQTLGELLNTSASAVDVFSVRTTTRNPPQTDVRFYVRDRSRVFNTVKLSGILLMHRTTVERALNVSVAAVGTAECLQEGQLCETSCTARVSVSPKGHPVSANSTVLTGLHVTHTADCVCAVRDFRHPETCHTLPCLNQGSCLETQYGPMCTCLPNYDGPRCQQTSREFHGAGWAWYPGLVVCSNSHLSLEFLTLASDGLLLYNGPLAPPNPRRKLISDFISIELVEGTIQLLLNLGSGTVKLTVPGRLDEGGWHRVDVLWDSQEVRLVVDVCARRSTDSVDGDWSAADSSNCLATSPLPLFNVQLNVDSPLQLGGVLSLNLSPSEYGWTSWPRFKSFNGCIRNVVYNGENSREKSRGNVLLKAARRAAAFARHTCLPAYKELFQIMDLAGAALSRDSSAGCSRTQKLCAACSPWSWCDATSTSARCLCHPGHAGLSCSLQTVPSTFSAGGFVKYSLAFQPSPHHTRLQLRFRTREIHGELFRLVDQHHKEYAILEIKERTLQVRLNLNSGHLQEIVVSLEHVKVDDGRWHVVKVSRYGSAVVLQLDGGEGRRYNESFQFRGHQLLLVDKQEGVFVGGSAPHVGSISNFTLASFQHGCLDDIRLEGKHLPLPPSTNTSQWGQVTAFQGVESRCLSRSVCADVQCPDTFVCQDNWNDYVCTCGMDRVATSDGKACTERGDCLCLHGGLCVKEPGQHHRCLCPEGYLGQHCQIAQELQTINIGMGAVCTIAGCLLLILLFVLLLFTYTRRRLTTVKKPTEDDVRENIVSYQDEGGGKDDLNAIDLLPLGEQVKEQRLNREANTRLQVPELIGETGCRHHMCPGLEFPPSVDDLRYYTFEGACDSIADSLSSLDYGEGDCERGTHMEKDHLH